MKTYQRLACSFALAAAAGGAVPVSAHDQPVPAAPPSAPAVSYMTEVDKRFTCNITTVGPGVTLVAPHCFEEETPPFHFHDRHGRALRSQHAYVPHADTPGWVDRHADQRITDDPIHESVARDKAILYTGAPADALSVSIMKLAPLRALTWRSPAARAAYEIADVFLLSYWPGDDDKGDHTLRKIPCNLVRLKNVSEMLLHNCPEIPGISGSPIVVENAPDDYSVVAIHHGATFPGDGAPASDDYVGVIMHAALPGRKIGLASGVWSLRRACDTLPCTVQYDLRGHASFHFTP